MRTRKRSGGGIKRLGARTPTEARGFIAAQLRRRLGLVVSREIARLRLNRVQYIGQTNDQVRAGARFMAEQRDDRRGDAPPACAVTISEVGFAAYQAQLMYS